MSKSKRTCNEYEIKSYKKPMCNSLVLFHIHETTGHLTVDSLFDSMKYGINLLEAMKNSAVFVCSLA